MATAISDEMLRTIDYNVDTALKALWDAVDNLDGSGINSESLSSICKAMTHVGCVAGIMSAIRNAKQGDGNAIYCD